MYVCVYIYIYICAENIDYHEASWAAFPRTLTEAEAGRLGAPLGPPTIQGYDSEDTDDTYDDDETCDQVR